MIQIVYNNRTIPIEYSGSLTESDFQSLIANETGLLPSEYYLTQNGKRLPANSTFSSRLDARIPLRLQERLIGGKGGFGSMLRAIGAQIEKTTNREACRDLSGRRLRDINEEKRLKTYLEKQREAPEDEAARLQKKIDKLLAKPKHEFHDEGYNRARSDLTQNIDEAVQEGFLKAASAEKAGQESAKRKLEEQGAANKTKKKKVKGVLWLGADDLGSSSDSDSESGSDSACSSAGTSTSASSLEAQQTVTSDEDKNGEKIGNTEQGVSQ
ncbi:splicing regulator SDE2 [Toxorhynchites rutilus septentrionalis]|uniref:splicing regulator SDE2 n=1 Tax=Toxorhynchites rutilus septentrionalis TaxID=329112 RepID=UPI00247AD4A5|nr:splicing regulator SDE2 [Toxorhynchites rutilus septentrionalis]